MMEVLHISTPESWRGGEQQLFYLVEGTKNELQHTILCPENSILAQRTLGKHEVKLFRKKSVWNRISTCKKLIRKDSFSAIHVHDSKGHTIALLALILSGKKVPLVVSRRVDFPIAKNWMSKWKYNHKRVSKIACVSHAILKICEPDIREREKLSVIHSGIDIQAIGLEKKGVLRKEYHIPRDKKIIGCVAALAPHKDHVTLLKAIQYLKNDLQASHFHVLLIGEGELRGSIESFISQNQLENEITLTGFRRDVKGILCELDVFLIASKTEGLGTSIIDAMAAGLPVITTRAGGIPELVEHEKTGCLAPVGDFKILANYLNELLNNPELSTQFSKNSRQRATEFSAEKMALKYLELYRQISSPW